MARIPVRQKHARDSVIFDGKIADQTNAPDATFSYTYFNIGADGFRHFSVEHLLQNTTLTIEATNQQVYSDVVLDRTASGAGSTTTIIDAGLNTVLGYNTDGDLIGAHVKIVDDVVPGNIGQTRIITAYSQATGTMTFVGALPGATSTSTKYQIIDTPLPSGGRLTLDPPSTLWRDVTAVLTSAATHTSSGVWFIDTSIIPYRVRIKKLITNATNSCKIFLTRGR